MIVRRVWILSWLVVGWTASGSEGIAQKRPEDAPLRAAREALAGGRTEEAIPHFLNALKWNPRCEEALEGLLRSLPDPDSKTAWALDWARLVSDDKGRLPEHAVLVQDPWIAELESSRVRALEELSSLRAKWKKRVAKKPELGLLVQWASRLMLDLGVVPSTDPNLSPRLDIGSKPYPPILKALDKAMSKALSARRVEEAIRAARLLRGLACQASFKDLEGPRPKGLEAYGQKAQEGLAKARAWLKKDTEPWTLEGLDDLSPEEGEALTRRHGSFSSPAVAVTPKGLYRVETNCGFETLYGVTETVEDHHFRLATWFGNDPFDERQGTVRIVPEATGLEAEGAPFWWVGGFQGGDLTVLRMSCGTIEGLGRGLTHELTHRFDGALYPGLPAWLLEGKAVWTQSAYGHSSDSEFVDGHVNFGTMENAFYKGYGGSKKLRELIEGTIEDYRDNYVAGYALYVYLDTWKPGESPIYASRLQTFMDEAHAGNKKPFEFFCSLFADGEDGRPQGFDAFAQAFGEFLRGFYWKDRKPFTKQYKTKVSHSFRDDYVYDEPTWTWSRVRAEPTFGEGQAEEIGRFFEDISKPKEAIRSFMWALAQDDRAPSAVRSLQRVLGAESRTQEAWVLSHHLAFPDGRLEETPLAPQLMETLQYSRLLDQAARVCEQSERPLSAAALRADRHRLHAFLGGRVQRPTWPTQASATHPFDALPQALAEGPLIEDGLAGYEERRVEGLWFPTDDGDLHIGRKKSKAETLGRDREARQRHAFVRSETWQLPGAYRLSTRVRFTTAYVSGAVILGSTRRDRNIRFHFQAGDMMYAIGEHDKEPTFESVRWRWDGRRLRDGSLTGSLRGGRAEFEGETSAFDLELIVDGAHVRARIDGKEVGNYHTVDGQPIEGCFGFASDFGAYVVERPIVQRLERSKAASRPGLSLRGLDLDEESAPPFSDLVNRRVRGMEPSSNGRLLVWIPAPEEGLEERLSFRVEMALKNLRQTLRRHDVVQPITIAIPTMLEDDALQSLEQLCRDMIGDGVTVVEHSLLEPEGPDEGKRWLIFVDSTGIARVVSDLLAHVGGMDSRMLLWLSAFRDHGRPQRDLPEAREPGEPAEEDDFEDEEDGSEDFEDVSSEKRVGA